MVVWAAARGRVLVWEMESASVILDTQAVCVRAALTATSKRKALMTAQEHVQVRHQPSTCIKLGLR